MSHNDGPQPKASPGEFTLQFNGERFADGTIHVDVLAETLTSFQNLFDAVNESLNGPDAPPIVLRVKSMSGEPE